MKNGQFFDSASPWYDKMVNFNDSIIRRKKFYKDLLIENKKSVADIGCGTGIDSIALSLLGFDVVGFDISEGMLNNAKENAKKFDVEIPFKKFDFSSSQIEIKSQYDYIISMGNTVANIPDNSIKSFIKNVKNSLFDNGKFVFQLVNFEKLIKANERILSITNDDNDYFIRFYDYHDNYINFNILKFNKMKSSEKELLTTKLYPYILPYLVNLIEEEGLEVIDYFSGFDRGNFNVLSSPDIIIIVGKKDKHS